MAMCFSFGFCTSLSTLSPSVFISGSYVLSVNSSINIYLTSVFCLVTN